MRRLFLIALARVIGSGATVVPATATTMVESSIEELTFFSESVVRATTISTEASWDQHRRIVTTGRFRVLEVPSRSGECRQ